MHAIMTLVLWLTLFATVPAAQIRRTGLRKNSSVRNESRVTINTDKNAIANTRLLVDFTRYTAAQPPPRYDCRTTEKLSVTFQLCYYAAEEDIWVSSSIAKQGMWEESKMRDMHDAWQYTEAILRAHGIASGIVFLDVGANLGLFSLYAAATGVGKVLAFEPLSANAGLFIASILRNRGFAKKIQLYTAGAGDRVQRSPMWVDLTNRGGSSFSRDKIVNIEQVPEGRQRVVQDCNIVPLDMIVRE
jgi:FkbM family methyltransferase